MWLRELRRYPMGSARRHENGHFLGYLEDIMALREISGRLLLRVLLHGGFSLMVVLRPVLVKRYNA